MALVIGDLQTARRDAALQEPMEQQYERGQSYHPQGLLLLPELGSDFQHAGAEHMAPSTTLSSCLHPLLLELFPPAPRCGCHSICLCSIFSLAPAPPDICGPVRKKSHCGSCMIPVTP